MRTAVHGHTIVVHLAYANAFIFVSRFLLVPFAPCFVFQNFGFFFKHLFCFWVSFSSLLRLHNWRLASDWLDILGTEFGELDRTRISIHIAHSIKCLSFSSSLVLRNSGVFWPMNGHQRESQQRNSKIKWKKGQSHDFDYIRCADAAATHNFIRFIRENNEISWDSIFFFSLVVF